MAQAPLDDEAMLGTLPLPVRSRVEAARERQAALERDLGDPNNLDELDELNPEPVRFTVLGRALMLDELPHTEHMRVQRRMARLQARLRGKAADLDEADIESVDEATCGVLDDLFGPFNDWLAPLDVAAHEAAVAEWGKLPEAERGPEPKFRRGTFFGALSERKLSHLTTRAFEHQQSFAVVEETRAGKAGVDTRPFERALTSAPSPGATSTSA